MSGREWTHDELQELLGAYALDAVDPAERDVIDAHLRDCPRCRAEVAEHREVAALLANAGADAPPGVWDRITDTIEGPPAPVVVLDRARRAAAGEPGGAAATPAATAADAETTQPTAGRPARRWSVTTIGAAALAAAAVVAIALLGWRVVDQGDQIDRMQAAVERGGIAQAALAAQAAPDARNVDLVDTNGRTLATAVVLPDGTGYLVRDSLRPLDPGRTYQLWAVVGDRTISAGVLGNDPSVLAFRAPDDATALALTDEVAGGVVQSREKPVAAGAVRSA